MNILFKNICLLSTAFFGISTLTAQQAPKNEGLLVVAFGTSHKKALSSYRNTEKTLCSYFPGERISWAYTSDIIRRKLAKEGRPVPSIQESMKNLSEKGIKTLRIQSLHIAAGEEFSQMERTVQRYVEHNPNSFDKVLIGRPLLESDRDLKEAIKAILSGFPVERKSDEAILMMGHGQSEGRADLVFTAVRSELSKQDPKAFLATVEGSCRFEDILSQLKALQKKGLKTVWLAPFLIVSGDHANNDMAGTDEDSWINRLKKEGFEVKTHLKGLGDMKGIQDIFLRHAIDTKDDIMVVKKGKE